MIRARLKYPSGQTAIRQGSALIDAALAGGCVIVDGDPANAWPAGLYDAHVERANGQHVEEPPKGQPMQANDKPKRGRPRKNR